MYRIGFDIGGTFTDLVALNEQTGEIAVVKCPTTPSDPSLGVINGLKLLFDKLKTEGKSVSLTIHSTTLASNTVIERKGGRTALITTKGFRDVLEIGRERRAKIYDTFEEKLPPLVPRRYRFEINERVLYNGIIQKSINIKDAKKIVKLLRRNKIESVAISLLHSYANPKNEQILKRLLKENSDGLFISLSSEILQEWREYERTSTTVINAYVQPRMKEYLEKIQRILRESGYLGKLMVMQSSGGLTTAEFASIYPVKIIESGPTAGVLAATYIGRLAGIKDLVSFDMGGTTTKCCLVRDGRPTLTPEFEVAGVSYLKGTGYPIRIPAVDLLEIGAGGGSIAHIEYGVLKVGPESAGASPGPACYPGGGNEPTVTDADLVLGYLNPDYFLGGDIKLNTSRAYGAIKENIAEKLGISVEESAKGIFNVVTSNMSRAIRIISVERGYDPTKLSMVAFGGAGPVHGPRLAQQLKIPRVLVPMSAGVTSALGLLVADMKFDFVKTYKIELEKVDAKVVQEMYYQMKEMARETISIIPKSRIKYLRFVDMRYSGQAFELTVPFGNGFTTFDFEGLRKKFLQMYKERYGYTSSDPVECVSWRLVILGSVPKVSLQKRVEDSYDLKKAVKGRRKVYLPEFGRFLEVDVYDRYKLFPGAFFEGPAIIEERESTCVVGANQNIQVDNYMSLRIETVNPRP
jgi:N-methylhydantoinase A